MPYKRGEVVLVRFPYTNLTQYKQRPAIVIQDENVPTGFDQRIVAQITSNVSRIGATRVPVAKSSARGQRMGLLSDSVILADKLATVEPGIIAKALGICPQMRDVDTALAAALRLAVR